MWRYFNLKMRVWFPFPNKNQYTGFAEFRKFYCNLAIYSKVGSSHASFLISEELIKIVVCNNNIHAIINLQYIEFRCGPISYA